MSFIRDYGSLSFVARKPRLYGFDLRSSDPISGENVCVEPGISPRWWVWGWHSGAELCDLINTFWGHDWTPLELLERFGIQKKVAKTAKKIPTVLIIGVGTNNVFAVVNFSSKVFDALVESDADFLVPSGWVDMVFNALNNGCTQFRVLESQVVGCEEDGRGIYYA